MLTAVARKLRVNLMGVIGAVCNNIGHNAYRPDDVLTTYNGKIIEIINTDAESCLVLADCLAYTEKILNPATIISLATLTGAAISATGRWAPIFSKNPDLIRQIEEAAQRTGEMVLYFPMDDYLAPPQLESKIA